jgi:hypothetical protein
MMGEVADLCIHEMTKGFCAICNTQKAKPAGVGWGSPLAKNQHDLPQGPRTQSGFESDCKRCDGAIDEGDWVFRRNGEWVCLDCAESLKGTDWTAD